MELPSNISLPQARILVAEDNRISGMILHSLLVDLGYQANWVQDGQQALDATDRDLYDIAVIDLRMPVMDGLSFTQEFRRREEVDNHMPIIALTAHYNNDVRQRCFDIGMDEFLIKPVDRETLNTVIQNCLKA